MKKQGSAVIATEFGSVELVFEGSDLKKSLLTRQSRKTSLGLFADHPAVVSLLSYLEGDLDAPSRLSFKQSGTPFRQKVWAQMCRIAPGSTMTYGQVASLLHSSPRAVGQACGDNQLPIFVPCHRIVGKKDLGGFAHGTSELPIKQWLLNHERKYRYE